MTILDEALDRLRDTGPERDGWLSNHAPMAVEALVHTGHGDRVHRWIDDYAGRLEQRPRGIARIHPDQWRDPLGDPVRTGDWLDLFDTELRADPWRQVLLRWWPRLLPGIAAGATHGVIRVGHAVRALQAAETPARVTELGQGLAYWAARWQPLAPAGAGPYPSADPRAALDAVPRIPDQRFGIRHRLAQLADLPRWPSVPDAGAATTQARLFAVVAAAARRHGEYGHGSPVMMVHAVTAPNAVRRVLPVLPESMWPASLAAAWAATAAITAAYTPADARPLPPPRPGLTVVDLADRAAATGDPHAIKYADAVADVLAAAPDPVLLTAALRSVDDLA
ncbi:questin oxidase family protein [Actinoplanes sp. CA-252034]|uniref:questin oxidase family protein n=1 Tax=Actinoplanes sp. CA-252034 TaxID=3239906 RepID=UPI003D99A864